MILQGDLPQVLQVDMRPLEVLRLHQADMSKTIILIVAPHSRVKVEVHFLPKEDLKVAIVKDTIRAALEDREIGKLKIYFSLLKII